VSRDRSQRRSKGVPKELSQKLNKILLTKIKNINLRVLLTKFKNKFKQVYTKLKGDLRV
jgi:hypothetical protein